MIKLPSKCRPSEWNESVKSAYADILLVETIRQVKKDLNVGSQVWVKTSADSDLLPNSKGRLDFVIRLKGSLKRTNLIVVEVKAGDVDTAVQQCMLYMVRAAELNADGRPVYGSCTNAKEWNFIVYQCATPEQEAKFTILFEQQTIIPRMDEERDLINEAGVLVKTKVFKYEDLWIERYSTIVKIFYTCLMNLLSDEKPKN